MTNLRVSRVQRHSLTTDERGHSSGQDCVVTARGEVEGHHPCHHPGHIRLTQRGGIGSKQHNNRIVFNFRHYKPIKISYMHIYIYHGVKMCNKKAHNSKVYTTYIYLNNILFK